MKDFLFVYGWLKMKYDAELPFKMPRKKIGEAHVHGQLFYVADYPGIVLGGHQKVYGELYEIPAHFDWTSMDMFEVALPTVTQNPEYKRTKTISYTSEKKYSCWVYEYLHDWFKENLIADGRF